MKSWFDSSKTVRTQGGQYAGFARITEEIRLSFAEHPEVERFFEDLQLLKGVPVAQLLIDDALLPAESLRFFYLDQNWVDCLIDGALSIGRNSGRDAEYDSLLLPHIIGRSLEQSRGRRSRIYGLEPPEGKDGIKMRTGFLLRSELVSGWPGLEVVCYGGGRALPTLRLSQICPDVMLCIAEGLVEEIEFTEPGESACFRFCRREDEIVQSLASLAPDEIGSRLNLLLTVPFREGADGVVDIRRLTARIGEELEKLGKSGPYFSSLEFAVEMLHGRTKVYIQLDWEERGQI